MNYKIQVYLKNWSRSVEYFLLVLQTLHSEEQATLPPPPLSASTNDNTDTVAILSTPTSSMSELFTQIEEKVMAEMISIIQKEKFFYEVLSKMITIEREILLPASTINTATPLRSIQVINTFLNKIRYLYANQCVQEMNYGTAIHYYLTIDPPMYTKAIDAALAQSDWMLALTLAGRLQNSGLSGGGEDSDYLPTKIAQDIVYNFQQNQEYFSVQHSISSYSSHAGGGSTSSAAIFSTNFTHLGDYFADKLLTDHSNAKNNRGNTNPSNVLSSTNSPLFSGSQETNTDKSLLAAKISIDYCEDVETAVNILTHAYHWMDALSIAIQHQRLDLLEEV